MKTTIDIADPVFEQAKDLAARRGTTLKALVERGLRQVIAEQERAAPFVLRKASFRGSGLQAGVADADWPRLRDMAYEGRGA